MASELRASGVDFSFAPVVDLARGNAAIGLRAFHADPAVAGELGQAYVRGMHLGGMAAVLKHFPGHGSVTGDTRSEEHTSELQSLMRISYAVFCLKKKKKKK